MVDIISDEDAEKARRRFSGYRYSLCGPRNYQYQNLDIIPQLPSLFAYPRDDEWIVESSSSEED